jgi:hypothetical protein
MVVLVSPPRANAIPAFSRQYGTSCSTCHLDFPKLNDFGKAFKDAGFKFPTDDEAMLKIPPVLLGAPANKELWPHTIWPGSIPGLPPIGLRMNNFFQITGKNRNNFQFVPVATGVATAPANPASIGGVNFLPPKTDFETGFFSIFTAGNFGSDIAFWVDDDISVSGANANGTLGDGYLRFVNLSRFVHMPKDSLSLRFGTFELDLPFSQARTWNISPWDIYTQANIGTAAQPLVSNGFTFSSATGPAGQAKGVEISGGHHYGGYWYSLAVFDQNTTGVFPATAFVPSATGGNSGGLPLGFTSDSNYKDLYGHFEYRFNLEKDKASRNAIQAAGATGPRDHTYLSLGGFYMNGRAVQRVIGVVPAGTCVTGVDTSGCVLLTARLPFYRVGADFSFNYRAFNLFGLWMNGRDHSLVPNATPVLAGVDFPATGFVHGIPATFSGGFLQADYLLYPWMMLIMRYDAVNSREDFINGQSLIPSNFFAPAHTTRNRYTPGVQFLIHANIKASFEYQIRPEQQIIGGTNPLTGAIVNVSPFRVNTAVAGLEFVY